MSSYNLGTAQGRIVIDGSDAEKGFSVAEAAAQSFQTAIQEQMSAIDQIANKLLVIGASGSGAMALLTNSAAGFQEKLSGIKAVSGATAEEMDSISKKALEIGARTVYSASESAAAIEELIKAGLSISDVMSGAADATVDLAAAGEINLPRAAEIAANAMNNFNLAGSDMPRIADLIAGAANASAIDVEQFGMSLSQVGAVASIAGLSFDDTAVAIAEMGNAGIKGSDAGTSLKTMFMNLIPSTDRQKDKFRELGLITVNTTTGMENLAKNGIRPLSSEFNDVVSALGDYVEEMGGAAVGTADNVAQAMKLGQEMGVLQNAFFDAEGNVKSMGEIQGILADTTREMTSEQKLMNLEILFGSDAIRAAAVMSEAGAEGYNAMAAAMGNVTAQDVAATRLDNLRGSMEQLRGSLETLSIDIGTYFLKPAQRMVDMGTAVVNFFQGMPDYVKAAAATLLSFGSGLAILMGTAIKVIPVLATMLAKMLGIRAARQIFDIFASGTRILVGGGGTAAAMAAMSAKTAELGGWLARLMSRSKVFLQLGIWIARAGGALAAFATGPVGIAIAIIAGLALLGKILYDKWEPFRNLVDKIVASIVQFFTPAVEGIKAAWEAFLDVMSGGNGGDGLPPWLQKIIPIFDSVKMAVDTLAAAWTDTLWPALQEAGSAIGGAFMSAWQTLSDVFVNTLMPAFQNLARVIVEDVWPALVNLWNAIYPIVRVVAIVVGALIGGLLFALLKIAEFVIGTVLPVLVRFAGWLVSGLITVLAAVAGWIIEYLLTPFIQVVSWIAQKVAPVFEAVASAIGTAMAWVRDNVGPIIESIGQWFQGLFDGAKQGADTAGNVFSTIGQWFSDLWTSITTIVTNVASAIAAPFLAIYNFIVPIVTALWNFLLPIFTAGFALIQNIVGLAWDIISGIFRIGASIIQGVATSIWNGLVIIWTALTSFLGTAWQAAIDFVVGIWNNIYTFLTTTFAMLRDTVILVWDAIRNAFVTAWNAIWAFIQPALDLFSSIWNTVWSAVASFLEDRWNNIKNNLTAAWNAIWGFISPAVTAFSNMWNTAWTAVSEVVGRAWDAVKTAVSNGWNNVVSFFSGASTWLVNVGSDIIQGLINGINDKVSEVREAVSGIIDSIDDNIRNFFGISSPAKLTIQYGKWIAEGLAIGVDDETRNLLDTVSSMSSAVDAQLISAYPTMPLQSYAPTQTAAPKSETVIHATIQINADDLDSVQDIVKLFEELPTLVRAE